MYRNWSMPTLVVEVSVKRFTVASNYLLSSSDRADSTHRQSITASLLMSDEQIGSITSWRRSLVKEKTTRRKKGLPVRARSASTDESSISITPPFSTHLSSCGFAHHVERLIFISRLDDQSWKGYFAQRQMTLNLSTLLSWDTYNKTRRLWIDSFLRMQPRFTSLRLRVVVVRRTV